MKIKKMTRDRILRNITVMAMRRRMKTMSKRKKMKMSYHWRSYVEIHGIVWLSLMNK